MTTGDPIRHLRRDQLEDARWNAVIRDAPNGRIYATTEYLDHMADNWDALVLGNYAAVMPLPWRRKFGISYLYQPALTAQLGIFGNDITGKTVESFLDAIPSRFRLWDLSLNQGNLFDDVSYDLSVRINYVLNLDHPYDALSANYRDNIRRNIRKCRELGCTADRDFPVEEVIGIVRLQPMGLADADLEHFKKLYPVLRDRQQATTYGIRSAGGDLMASCVFFFSHGRAYYILVGNHPNGRTLGASHALIDAFIRDHAGKQMLLDFEGSDLRNLAFFYSSFGAMEEHYPAIHLNRLPRLIRWLK
ncbi:MAG TPA: GNAT family N-acetyltransferase [Flavisolibacter sp.]